MKSHDQQFTSEQQNMKNRTTYMLLVRYSTRVPTLHILKNCLKFHTLPLDCAPSMLQWTCIPIGLKGLVRMKMLGDSWPICLARLLIANNWIRADILPRFTKLDIFILRIVATSLLGFRLSGLNRCTINISGIQHQICVRAFEIQWKLIQTGTTN
jgi:hypothetical protein